MLPSDTVISAAADEAPQPIVPPVSKSSGTSLAWWLFAYVIIVVGRPHEWIPALMAVPFAKIAFGGALLAAYANRTALSTPIFKQPIARTAMFFFALCVLSIPLSIWPIKSMRVVTDGIVTLAFSFALIVKLGSNWSALRIIIRALPWSAGILALNSLSSYTGVRPSGTAYYDPNDLAFVMVALLPVICAAAIVKRGLQKILFWGLALCTLVATLLTESRGGLIGLALVIPALCIFSVDPRKAQLPRGRRVGRIITNLLLVAVIGVTVWTAVPQSARSRLATVMTLEDDYNMTERNGRWSIWKRNVAAGISRPIGFGVGSFMAVDIRTGGKWNAPHNTLVQVFVELGVLGLWLYLRLFYLSWRELRQVIATGDISQPNPETLARLAMCRALCISLIGVIACGFFLSQAYSNLPWALFAIIAALTASVHSARTGAGNSPRWQPVPEQSAHALSGPPAPPSSEA
jgi:hypothetical protein